MDMTRTDLNVLMQQAMFDHEMLERFLDVFTALVHDAQFVAYSHDRYLPACRRYQDYLRGRTNADSSLKRARQMRGQLGGFSKAMYGMQRKTFEDVVKMLIPLPEPLEDFAVDALWSRFANLERQWLSAARKGM
jgi:hypothetical protein